MVKLLTFFQKEEKIRNYDIPKWLEKMRRFKFFACFVLVVINGKRG
jgi:hypothetical protein